MKSKKQKKNVENKGKKISHKSHIEHRIFQKNIFFESKINLLKN
jgi:hypothetical protein